MFQIHKWRAFIVVSGVSAAFAGPSLSAQSLSAEGPYVTVSAMGDLKRFSGDPETIVLSGNSVGGSVAVGSRLGQRWDIELNVDIPHSTDRVQERSVTFRRSLITLEERTRTSATGVGALVRFRATAWHRMTMGYLGGLTFVRLKRRFETLAPVDTADALIPKPQELIDYSAAATAGLDASVALTRHLSLVPALHVTAFSVRDTSGILFRPRVGARWTF